MSKIFLIKNGYGVTVNIRLPVQADPNLVDRLPLNTQPNAHPKTINWPLLVRNAKSVLIHLGSYPIVVLKKIIQFFETNPYHYPTYPFHFPILIYGDEYSFGYYDYWLLLENYETEAELSTVSISVQE